MHNVHETTLGYTFPSKIPDGWDESDISLSLRRLRKMITDILQEEHKFKPDWGAQSGFELFGLDVMFERKTKKPILLEFNKKPGLSNPSILKESIDVGNTESLFTRII